MIRKVKDLSPDQKLAIEGLLGRSVAESEAISIRAVTPAPPDWLNASWESAERENVNQLTPEEIEAEIASARKTRRDRRF